MYAAKGKWDEVAQLRRRLRDTGIRKEPGCSWITYKSRVHIFSADDSSSPYSDQIYAKLEKLYCKIIEEGYVPDMSSVLHDVELSEKIRMLNHHSEKLAIAFGLIFIPCGLPIRVVKNLRLLRRALRQIFESRKWHHEIDIASSLEKVNLFSMAAVRG
ncbi:putative pentatricopeptide repeat-containing protein [Camellia lanceoleosa]|uniref:Pentatricopeptide repeat-containing protein n=1 Tax=Camellia lanceoleosa TaxID=1840588 RepID=A0ACC0G0Y8_9ERIC|nr:putative pentatricopeptide repeat-containing protein [Camellia lanceoleosa]